MACIVYQNEISSSRGGRARMALDVDISTAVRRLNKNVDFKQSVCEAISNSLEANADAVVLDFFLERNLLDNVEAKIVKFVIKDNGDGFNDNNIKSFCTHMSEYKLKLGCRGVGKLTWLRVFKKVTIESVVNQEAIRIDFNTEFDKKKDITKNKTIREQPNKTTITFENLVALEKHFVYLKGKEDFEKFCDDIRNHLLIKLLLLKKNQKRFSIKLTLDDRSVEITDANIPELSKKSFQLNGNDKQAYEFDLYYAFVNDKQNKRYSYYCANGRSVCAFHKQVSNIYELPNKDSLIMLLASSYLDERVIDERNEFDIHQGGGDKFENLSFVSPLSFFEIDKQLTSEIQSVILERYPILTTANEEQELAAIEEAPYLKEYILRNEDMVKMKNTLISRAKKEFEKDKSDSKNRFANLLAQNDINPNEFFATIEDISCIAARELGEYIHYRQQIIEALKKLSEKNERIENLIHNLFMKRRTNSKGDILHLCTYDSNLWLLDDKFLSYSYAASDKQIDMIFKEQGFDLAQEKGRKAPDLAMFYSNKEDDDNLTCVLIEIKPFGIDNAKKFEGLAQVREYANIIYKNNPKIKAFWVYLITKIDSDFGNRLKRDEYKPLFSTADGHKIFMRYFPNEEPPMYLEVVCVDALIQDANARNRAFLNILQKH